MEVIYRKLSEMKKLDGNPRKITQEQLETLKQSIEKNKDYFEARPLILSNRTGELVIIAGNQRYEACKLLNKSLVTPIQFPSAIHAERQPMNGNRIHHRINKRYLMPCVIKNKGGRSNIAWDTYEEDTPFTNEPKRIFKLRGEEYEVQQS